MPEPRHRPATVPRPGALAAVLVAWLLVILILVGPAPARAAEALPAGYRVEESTALAPGIDYRRLVRPEPPVTAHVVRLSPDAQFDLRAVLSNERVGEPSPTMERTSEMCRRVSCVTAVNGDFAFPAGEPVGGLVSAGQLLRSPAATHHQLSVAVDGSITAGTVAWSGQLVPSDLRPLTITGVNVERGEGDTVLYSDAYGPSTRTNRFGAELVLTVVEPPPPLLLGQTVLVEFVALTEGAGDSPIPRGGLVVSAHGDGAGALHELWARAEAGSVGRRALLRLDSASGLTESIGGSPILLRNGERWVADDGSGFVAGRHPRTIVGWREREVFLVVVDGRQPGYSVGLDLLEAADLMAGLGATDALNLDGGGSTTLVMAGKVVNRPSDRLVRRGGTERVVHQPARGDTVVGPVERPVSTALAVVPRDGVELPSLDPLAGNSFPLPRELLLVPPASNDPGSRPGAGLPALLATAQPPSRSPAPAVVVALATMLVVAEAGALLVLLRRRRAAIS